MKKLSSVEKVPEQNPKRKTMRSAPEMHGKLDLGNELRCEEEEDGVL